MTITIMYIFETGLNCIIWVTENYLGNLNTYDFELKNFKMAKIYKMGKELQFNFK